MSRAATTRCALTLIAVVLLASAVLATTGPFAHAYTPRTSGRADRPTAALDREPAAGRGESVTSTPHTPESRGPRAPSRAALQVFRC
ncbi:hypothetical protein [Streptomyces sp. NPDC127114]|uniref:hypothetical protein n=1 Tax=Streptomyces sp. NPDC127114 TaxID=3345366 RepID=UPI00363B7206